MEKTKDHWPVAYKWGLIIWFSISFLLCKYYPKDAAWWQDILLWIGIAIVVIVAPIIWIPAPKKTEELDKEEEE